MPIGQQFSHFQQQTPQACVIDLTPPTSGAITSLTNNPDGSLKIQCAVAADVNGPIKYNYYVSDSLATLFDPSNALFCSMKTQVDVYRDKNAQPIAQGSTYYAGVRAEDALGNLNQNTTSLSIVAAGLAIQALIGQVLATFVPPGQSIEIEVNQDEIQIETNTTQEIEVEIREC